MFNLFTYLSDSEEIQAVFEQIMEEQNRMPLFVQNSIILCWMSVVHHNGIQTTRDPEKKQKKQKKKKKKKTRHKL